MKPISLRISNPISDSFFYMGKLFLLTKERELKFIENDKLFELYLTNGNPQVNFWLKKIFFSNENLPSYYQYQEKQIKHDFLCVWSLLQDKIFEFEIQNKDLQLICKLPENEALDFVIYAQRAYLANRDGLFECQLNIHGENVEVISNGFQRVFDSKTINLNPRAGKVLISTKNDGLFVGSIESRKDHLQMTEKKLSSSSIRTGWVEYDFVNYNSPIDGDFFRNETEEQVIEGLNFKLEDGSSQNRKITEVGTEQIALNKMFADRTKKEKIIFSFNSLSKSFNVLENGHIFYNSFANNSNSIILANMRFDLANLGYPLSAYTVPGGTVYEFFDKVILVKGGRMETIGEIECKQIRTFSSSRWFQNILMTLSDDFLDIHSIHPYE